ncbi:MAG: phosphatidylserine decarboxylase family protein [Cytophagales bacterium]|nr:phosphatidylserine decarboxylase family protein [Cytophagales bacterium]
MTIHKEGYGILIGSFVVFTMVNIMSNRLFYNYPTAFNVVLVSTVLLYLVILQFFRSPKRTVTVNPNHILAPADGKVVVIEETVENEFFQDKRIQVSIFMSPFNVHSNRNPVSGKVSFFKYHPGLFLMAWEPKASTDNERTTIVVETPNHGPVMFRQIAGFLARRIKWYVKENDNVTQGNEFGFIKFGSRVDIFLPLTAKINVKIGDRPVAGKTVIAEF